MRLLLQVLRLARCELHDAGAAVILSALRSHPCLQELDLSWNALSHGTAKAAEAAFRCAWRRCYVYMSLFLQPRAYCSIGSFTWD